MGRGDGTDACQLPEVERFGLDTFSSRRDDQLEIVAQIERAAAAPMGGFVLDSLFNDQRSLSRVRRVDYNDLRERITTAVFSDDALDSLFRPVWGGLGERGLALTVYQAGCGLHLPNSYLVKDQRRQWHYRQQPFERQTICGKEIDETYSAEEHQSLVLGSSTCSSCFTRFRSLGMAHPLKIVDEVSRSRKPESLGRDFPQVEQQVREELRSFGSQRLFDTSVRRIQDLTDPLYDRAIDCYGEKVISSLVCRTPSARHWALFNLAGDIAGAGERKKILEGLGKAVERSYRYPLLEPAPDMATLQERLREAVWQSFDTATGDSRRALAQLRFVAHYCALVYSKACNDFYFGASNIGSDHLKMFTLWQEQYKLCQ